MRHTITIAVLLALFMPMDVAHANDPSGQYPGVYVLEGSHVPANIEELDVMQLKCLLAPGVMHDGGFGVGYFLDRELFFSTGEISYIKGQEYRCRYSAETRRETCDSKEFSDGKSLTYYRNNVYETFTREVQRGHSLLTPEEVLAWNSRGEVNPANRFAYHRCDCLQGGEFEARASKRANELSSAETGWRLFWWNRDITDQELDLAQTVRKKFGACRPAIS